MVENDSLRKEYIKITCTRYEHD